MSLPPGFLDELRDRVPISRVIGRKVQWDARKSNAAKGDWWAPCPFHQEKTPSFHVDDGKGFYYCFGCHAKGDALTFLREADGMSFMEAVEALAAEAGVEMPARDPRAAEKADRASRLAEVLEQANRYYRLQFSTAAAAHARDYAARRGLDEATLERFEIGFAPDARAGAFAHLRDAGVAAELIDAAGISAISERDGSRYDRLRNRLTFPIRDLRGRLIGFGGRALNPNDHAKYLNSPETALFDKGRSLYNASRAREAVARGGALVVVEGYMDVIALTRAGFGGAVAPLGTAITEDQLRLLWRLSPEPVVALDGDAAGLRAGLRLMDLALPLMEAGQGLRFALLPAGQDPDDLLRGAGPAAMQSLVETAVPMVQLLWRRETEGQVLDSPERRAALDKRLRAAILRIRDASLRSHYGAEIARLRNELFGRPRREAGRGPHLARGPAAPLPATRGTALAVGDETVEDRLREAVILATLVTHPDLLPRFEQELETLECLHPEHATLRDVLLRHLNAGEDLRAAVRAEAPAALENLFSQRHVNHAPPVCKPEDSLLAMACLEDEVSLLAARRAIRREVQDAMQDIVALPDESLTWRLGQAAEAVHRAARTRVADANDLDEDREALLRILEQAGEVCNPKKR